MPKNFKTYTEFRPIKNTGNGIFANSNHGLLHIWADGNGIYIDMTSTIYGDVCLAGIYPSEKGLTLEVYGDHKAIEPTYTHLFDNLKEIFDFDFGFCMNDEESDKEDKQI